MNTGFLRPIANPNVLLYLFACYINDSGEMKDLVLVQMDQAIRFVIRSNSSVYPLGKKCHPLEQFGLLV